MSDTFAVTQKTIAELAAKDYAEHIVEPQGLGEWRFRKPGTSIMWSAIIVRPWYVIVYGDVGEWILRHSERDSLAWLRGAVRSRDYLLEKVKAGDTERFYPADAMEELRPTGKEDDAHDDALRAKVKAELDPFMWNDEPTEYEWGRAWAEAGGDDPPRCRYASEGGLWLWETLKAFIRTLDASKPDALPNV